MLITKNYVKHLGIFGGGGEGGVEVVLKATVRH